MPTIEAKPRDRHPLIEESNLYYSRAGASSGRTLEEAAALAFKFEAAFAKAWNRVPARHRKALLNYWGSNFAEANGSALNHVPVRLQRPWAVPQINLTAEPSHGRGEDLGDLDNGGEVLNFWAPAVEAMPTPALVALILFSLAHVVVWAEIATRPESSRLADDPERRRQCVEIVCVVDFRCGRTALARWVQSEAGRRFVSEWDRLLDLMREAKNAPVH